MLLTILKLAQSMFIVYSSLVYVSKFDKFGTRNLMLGKNLAFYLTLDVDFRLYLELCAFIILSSHSI